MTNEPFTVSVSRLHEQEEWRHENRTIEQFEVVRKIVQDPTFDFACGSFLFSKGRENQTESSFAFVYYTKDGVIHLAWVTPKGRVKKHYTHPPGFYFSGDVRCEVQL